MFRLGILGSTRGTLMLDVIQAIEKKNLAADIALVISNKPNALILENAARHGLTTHFLNPAEYSREDYDQAMSNLLTKYEVDLIVLIGYMRILSEPFVTAWKHKIINVHPSLLPAHAGKMDRQVHQAVLDANELETGCTVHHVTKEVDAGPILVQLTCPVLSTDDVETLRTRVQQLEGLALIEAINKEINV